jgi:2-keto-4-pentenoate hydratase/2-oxohepta-3-ene-1,7-dioic acid hydratase in catechol pathway
MKRRVAAALATVLVLASQLAPAQLSSRPETPFKLANFEVEGRERPGMLLDERLIDIARANDLVTAEAELAPMSMPSDLKMLIEQADAVMPRLYQIANFLHGKVEMLDFAYRPQDVAIKAPIKYPWTLLAAGQNYRAHAAEMGGATDIDPDEDDPFLFQKSPRSTIADPGQPYVIPPGRDRIDWEGEFAVVVGKQAKSLTVDNAMDYVFGFTIVYDISDRAAQIPDKGRYERNWYAGKSMDGAAPMGPYVVPKTFLPNYDDLHIMTRINGEIMQDSTTAYLIHDVPRLLRYATRTMTLWPGDVIATGTPEGVGNGRNPPVYLKPGDVVEVEVEGIGTLVTPIR